VPLDREAVMSGDSWFMTILGVVVAALATLMTYGVVAAPPSPTTSRPRTWRSSAGSAPCPTSSRRRRG
jgi:hypothetical protein